MRGFSCFSFVLMVFGHSQDQYGSGYSAAGLGHMPYAAAERPPQLCCHLGIQPE
jgi:hypothetical protein